MGRLVIDDQYVHAKLPGADTVIAAGAAQPELTPDHPACREALEADVEQHGAVRHELSGCACVEKPFAPADLSEADKIAKDLAANPPTADELARVTEPLSQLIRRASTGNQFWLYNLEGATQDPQRVALLRTLLADYSQTSPQVMQFLADRYLAKGVPFKLAIIPEGQQLATAPAGGSATAKAAGGAVTGR